MILVETVIRKLIVDYEFVILPGFGALLSHQVPALYNRETGIFSPPSKRLAFNESLRLDDGLLANYISRAESISHLEAVAYIKAYVEGIKIQLQQKGNALIEGIGSFHTNGEGKMVFDPGTGKYFKDEWYGLKPISAKLVANHKQVDVHDTVEAIELNSKSLNEQVWGRWIAAACLVVALCIGSVTLVRNNMVNLSSLNPLELIFSKSTPVVVNKSIAIAAKPKEPKPVVKEPVVEVIPKEEVLAKPVEVSTTGYYVIAGAFKDAKRADMLLGTLKKKGYTDALIMPKERKSAKIKVAVRKFDDEHEAYRASAKLKSVIGESGWVYYKKK